jgi:hypothetical protein
MLFITCFMVLNVIDILQAFGLPVPDDIAQRSAATKKNGYCLCWNNLVCIIK